MRFTFDRAELSAPPHGEGNCWLLANGLGGYMSTSAAFSVTRCDQGLLVAARSPSRRFCLVHRLREELATGTGRTFLSSQSFGDRTAPEEGWRHLSSFVWENGPEWLYEANGVRVRRQCGMEHGANTAAVVYTVENRTPEPCTLRVTPVLQFAPKGEPPQEPVPLEYADGTVRGGGLTLYIRTNGELTALPQSQETLFYADDGKDGRTGTGLGQICCGAELTAPGNADGHLELVFSTEPTDKTGFALLRASQTRRRALPERSGLKDPVARELVRSADAFIADRPSTGGRTIVAGYPFFSDWGRDTMIALPGCALSTGRYETAKSILRTFLAYEQDGLVPNYFPEGTEQPQYNSADAPLLLVNCVWLYYQRKGDADLVREAWPVLARIVRAYRTGTRYAIAMDADGLIRAGEGLDQVTWMDVRIDDVLPTPRHGKPVEINAYWYNALCAAAALAPVAGESGEGYRTLAERVKASFVEKFWMEDRGYLKDVLSGTAADTQLRCNQIWAASMPFSPLPPELARRVVETVYRRLYTPWGLRTLDPEDPQFHPFYGGSRMQRDMAYHQGTVWPFPLGAFYLAYLEVHGNTLEAARTVRGLLEPMESILREGCVGQLPEIYDGGEPGPSKGCFAQAWSVGELLRVYERLERIETTAAPDRPAGEDRRS